MFNIDEEMEIGSAQLNVRDLEKMKEYYTEIIGLEVIQEEEHRLALGVKKTNKELLVLHEVVSFSSNGTKAGLFHTALLVPSRKDLGNVLFSLLNKGVPVSGASDHGYSEAIYLQDPEDNGIEIYCDKPQKEWTINDDGTIPGITEEMDAEGVLKARDERPSGKLPERTKIGHMHLSVSDLDDSAAFYTNTLGLSLKYNYGTQARFLAAGGYHHHLGINTWAGRSLPERAEEDPGLRQYSLNLSSSKEFERLIGHLNEVEHEFHTEHNHIVLTDPNGIQVKVSYKKA